MVERRSRENGDAVAVAAMSATVRFQDIVIDVQYKEDGPSETLNGDDIAATFRHNYYYYYHHHHYHKRSNTVCINQIKK